MKKLICKIFGHRWKEFIRGDGTLRHYEIGGKKCVRCGKVINIKQ